MDIKLFLDKFKRLTVENSMLTQGIKNLRISKNNEIDEVEVLYNKTKQELDITSKELKEIKEKSKMIDQIYDEKLKYNNSDIINQLYKISEFKKEPEFKEFKEDFIKHGIYYETYYLDKYHATHMGTHPAILKRIEKYRAYINKHKHILKKFKILDLDIKSLLEGGGHGFDFNRKAASVVFDMYNFMFDIDIVKLYSDAKDNWQILC
jgi:hypothetical protein